MHHSAWEHVINVETVYIRQMGILGP